MRMDCLDRLLEECNDLMDRMSWTETLVAVLCSWWMEALDRLEWIDNWGFDRGCLETGDGQTGERHSHGSLPLVFPSLDKEDDQRDNL